MLARLQAVTLVSVFGAWSKVMTSDQASRQTRPSRTRSSPAKRRLCDVVEEMSLLDLSAAEKRERILPALHGYAQALAEQRAANLPGTTIDELVSTLGERCAAASRQLDLDAPPARQVTYLDSVLRHGLADACRNLDPLGRGPRRLRRRFEAAVEDHFDGHRALPSVKDRSSMLDTVVGSDAKPALKLLVGHGMSPDEAAGHMADSSPADDPGDMVAAKLLRRQIAKAIEAHPDRAIREYLFKVADGINARQPDRFHDRLGPTLPALLAELLLSDTSAGVEAENRPVAACR